MNISLPKEQLEWLEAEVAAGHFKSIDEAIAVAVADFRMLHDDDLTWARPCVDEARAQAGQGEVITGNEFLKNLNAKIEALRLK